MRFTLTINCDNADFGDTADHRNAALYILLHRAAHGLMGGLADDGSTVLVRDTNGNTVGSYGFTDTSFDD
jgi:hypothetical protein